jgi:DNA repair exonuclease SbcCD ATPase subunit
MSDPIQTTNEKVARIDERTQRIQDDVKSIKADIKSISEVLQSSLKNMEEKWDKKFEELEDHIMETYARKDQLEPLQKAVFAFFGVVSLAFLAAIVKMIGWSG